MNIDEAVSEIVELICNNCEDYEYSKKENERICVGEKNSCEDYLKGSVKQILLQLSESDRGEVNSDGLKPCPFCGSEPKFEIDDLGECIGKRVKKHNISCENTNCPTMPETRAWSYSFDAIKAWNTRANKKETPSVISVLEEVEKEIEDKSESWETASTEKYRVLVTEPFKMIRTETVIDIIDTRIKEEGGER